MLMPFAFANAENFSALWFFSLQNQESRFQHFREKGADEEFYHHEVGRRLGFEGRTYER